MESKQEKSKGWCWWILVLAIAAMVVASAVLTVWHNCRRSKMSSVPDRPGKIAENYAEALKIAIRFFDIQKCTIMHLLCLLFFLQICLAPEKVNWKKLNIGILMV